jgi:hypothetical protein
LNSLRRVNRRSGEYRLIFLDVLDVAARFSTLGIPHPHRAAPGFART